MVLNTTALFAVYIMDMENPRYFYNRLGRLSGLCAVLELFIYWQLYFVVGLYWGFFFVLVPVVTVYWLKQIT